MVGDDDDLGRVEHSRRAHLLHGPERHRAGDVVRHHDVAADHDDVAGRDLVRVRVGEQDLLGERYAARATARGYYRSSARVNAPVAVEPLVAPPTSPTPRARRSRWITGSGPSGAAPGSPGLPSPFGRRPASTAPCARPPSRRRAGSVIVVDGGGAIEPALCGVTRCRQLALDRGVAGVVVDGAVRDVDEIEALGFPVFAAGDRADAAADATGRESSACPSPAAGVTVRPGRLRLRRRRRRRRRARRAPRRRPPPRWTVRRACGDPAPDDRRRQLPAAGLADRPRPPRHPAAAARSRPRALARRRRVARAGPGRRDPARDPRHGTRRRRRRSPTARSAARATRTASPLRSKASTSTTPASRSTAPATKTPCRASSGRSDAADPSRCATSSSCARTRIAGSRSRCPGRSRWRSRRRTTTTRTRRAWPLRTRRRSTTRRTT